jgi:CRP/FNR family transcriptional regulator, anaerobic regulatory protein
VITDRPLPPSSPKLLSPAPKGSDPLDPLRQRATIVRVRRRQQIAFDAGPAEAVFIVRSGMLVLQSVAPGKHRQLLSILYPDDLFRAASAPPLPGLALTAVGSTEVWRMPAATFEAQIGADPAISQRLNQQLADQHARTILHVAMIGTLNGEERAASFLTEVALRIGSPCANGTSLEIPLSRTDVADYLSLNADTLSRIMSRLKARGILAQTGRDRIVVPDLKALCELTPIADTLIALHGDPTSPFGS